MQLGVLLMRHKDLGGPLQLGHVLMVRDGVLLSASNLPLLHKFYTRFLRVTEDCASVMIRL